MSNPLSTVGVSAIPASRYRTLGISLACFWAFHYLVLWSGVFAIKEPSGLWAINGNFTWLASIVFNALALLACYVKLRRRRTLEFERISAAAALITAVGIACIALRVAHPHLAFDAIYLAGTILFGVGTGLLMACYAARLREVTPQTTFMLLSAGFFCGAALCLLVSVAFVPIAAWTATAALPLVAARLYRKEPHEASLEESDILQTGVTEVTGLPTKSLFLLIGIVGLTAGFVRGTSNGVAGTPLPDILFIGPVLVASALLFALSFYINRLKPTLLLQIIVVIISGAFLAGSLLAGPSAPLAFIIHTVGFLFFVAFVWLLCTYLGNSHEHGAQLFIGGLLANQAGQALGSIAFAGMLVLLGPARTTALPISLGLLYLLLIAALIFFANTGRANLKTPQPLQEAGAQDILLRIAPKYKLTAREIEIGALVADGLTRADIAKQLTVSQETVKTHTKHVYQKLDVHSRAELLGLLREESTPGV